MSHTFKTSRGTYFNFNSDLSGNVTIQYLDLGEVCKVDIPGEDILAFIAEYVRKEKIEKIEQMGVDDLLNL